MQQQTVRQQIIDAARVLVHSGLLSRGEHASLSARLDDQHIVMTRGGSIGSLSPDD